MAPIHISPNDPIMQKLNFRPYRNSVERQVRQFMPGPGEAQTIEIKTPWGETLTCKKGDYIVSELNAPTDRWPVARDIFEDSYIQVKPGRYTKSLLTHLVPLTDLTGGNLEQEVIVHTLEGDVTVRAGDFYLARGIQGEIWPYPRQKAEATLVLVE
jgi:hypothetical protein